MSRVIRISDSIFARLQNLSTPLVDTPASVIERILDHYEETHGDSVSASVISRSSGSGSPKPMVSEVGLYLAPANEENLGATIMRSKPLSVAEEHLTHEQYTALKGSLKGASEFRCWAMTKNSRSKFNSMMQGDWVLFTSKGTGRFTFSARVIYKVESVSLGNALWSVVPSLPWQLIYFLDEVTRINLPKEDLVTALGYDEGYVVPGILRVSPARTQTVIDQYGGISEFVSSLNQSRHSAA